MTTARGTGPTSLNSVPMPTGNDGIRPTLSVRLQSGDLFPIILTGIDNSQIHRFLFFSSQTCQALVF